MRSTWRPVNHANLSNSWIKIIFGAEQKEGKNKQGKVPPAPESAPCSNSCPVVLTIYYFFRNVQQTARKVRTRYKF